MQAFYIIIKTYTSLMITILNYLLKKVKNKIKKNTALKLEKCLENKF